MPDYEKLLAELDAEVKARYPEIVSALQDAIDTKRYADEWRAWLDQNWDHAANMTRLEKDLSQRLQELESRFQQMVVSQPQPHLHSQSPLQTQPQPQLSTYTAQAPADYPVEPDDPTKRIIELVETRSKEIAERLANAFGSIVPKLFDAGAAHLKEFGEPLRGSELWDFMNKHSIADPVEAYDRMVADRRAEKSRKELEERIEAAKKAGKEEALKEVAAARMPTDNRGVPSFTLPRREEQPTVKIPEGARLGQGRLAAAAAEEYYRKGGT